jgi:hypothetical protein
LLQIYCQWIRLSSSYHPTCNIWPSVRFTDHSWTMTHSVQEWLTQHQPPPPFPSGRTTPCQRRDCLFDILAAIILIWRSSPISASRGWIIQFIYNTIYTIIQYYIGDKGPLWHLYRSIPMFKLWRISTLTSTHKHFLNFD